MNTSNKISSLAIIILSVIFSIGFISAYDSGWNHFNTAGGACVQDNGNCPDTACAIQGGYCGCSASGYGLDWIQLYTAGGCINENGYRFLCQGYNSDDMNCLMVKGTGMGKLFTVPNTGDYYVSISADWDQGVNPERLYTGVNDWGNDFNKRLAFSFLEDTQCVYKNKFAITSNPAKIWVEASSDSSPVHVKQFKVSNCLPTDVNVYCDDGTLIPASAARCGQTINCTSNLNCSDGNNYTEDICVNPGLVSSSCTHNNITCLTNADCGGNILSSLFCSGNNVFQNTTSHVCNNAATSLSFCSSLLTSNLNQTCSSGCLNGNCIISSTVPILTVLSPINGNNYTNTNFLLNATANQQIAGWNYSLNNRNNVSFIPGNFYNLIGLINGTNNLVIYGWNSNGTGNASVIFNLNTSSNSYPLPTIQILSPNQAYYNITNILINLSATNYQSIWFNWNGTNQSYVSPITVNVMNNGTYILWAYANNSIGNLSSANFAFNVNTSFTDNISPTIIVYSPEDKKYTKRAIVINFTATDASGISSKWYSNGFVNKTYNGPETLQLEDGTYNFIFYANDSFNNLGSLSVNFRVNSSHSIDCESGCSNHSVIIHDTVRSQGNISPSSLNSTGEIDLTVKKSRGYFWCYFWLWLLLLILILLVIIILVYIRKFRK